MDATITFEEWQANDRANRNPIGIRWSDHCNAYVGYDNLEITLASYAVGEPLPLAYGCTGRDALRDPRWVTWYRTEVSSGRGPFREAMEAEQCADCGEVIVGAHGRCPAADD